MRNLATQTTRSGAGNNAAPAAVIGVPIVARSIARAGRAPENPQRADTQSASRS